MGHPADCEGCADLREEVAFLRSELGIVDDAEELHELKHAFALRGVNEARVLRRLYAAPGAVSKVSLLDAMDHHPDSDPDIKVVDIYICRLRKRISFEAIETIWAIGWRLSDSGRTDIANVLEAYRAFKTAQRSTRRAAA